MSGENVITCSPIEIVVPNPARELVDAIAAIQNVIALFAKELIVVRAPIQQVISGSTDQKVVSGSTVQPIIAGRHRPSDAVVSIQLIVARPSPEDIIPTVTLEQVVAVAAIEKVSPAIEFTK
jgi:hypothetical protein